MKKHLSEYMTIMDILIKKYNDQTEERDVITGNLIRRVLEVFLNFKDTNTNHMLFNKLQNMAGENEKYKSLLNLTNAFSHTEEVTDILNFSYMAGKEEIELLFRFLKEKDPDHFKGFGITIRN